MIKCLDEVSVSDGRYFPATNHKKSASESGMPAKQDISIFSIRSNAEKACHGDRHVCSRKDDEQQCQSLSNQWMQLDYNSQTRLEPRQHIFAP